MVNRDHLSVRFAMDLLRMCINVVRFIYLLYQTLGMHFDEFVGVLYQFLRMRFDGFVHGDVIAADNGEEEDVIAADNGEEEDVTAADNVDQDQDEASSSSSQEDEDHHHVLRPGCVPHHVIENLPIAVKFGNSGSCALCLELYSVADVAKTLPCQHQFHAVCIDRHLRYQSSLCPICHLDVCPYQPNAEGR